MSTDGLGTDVHGGLGTDVHGGLGTDVHGGLGGSFAWSVSTPEGIAASGQCEFLVVPTTGGELGVLAGHAALVAGVLPGDLRVTAAGQTHAVSVGGGVVEVRDDEVRLLVTRAADSATPGAAASANHGATPA